MKGLLLAVLSLCYGLASKLALLGKLRNKSRSRHRMRLREDSSLDIEDL